MEASFPANFAKTLATLDGVIAESEKSARWLLKQYALKLPLQQFPIKLCNEHTKASEFKELLQPIVEGQVWGLMSDAGLPAIADPGSELVRLAYECKVSVRAVVGPSSIFMAVQLSGCKAQSFMFHGYLPQDIHELQRKLQELGRNKTCTHVVIETPYRNEKLLQACLSYLPDTFRLATASNLMAPNERVISLSIAEWKKKKIVLDRVPTVFVFSGCYV